MNVIDGYEIQVHQSQYGHSARLAKMGCTPTSGGNGASDTLGRIFTGDQVLSHLAKAEEQYPLSPGWTLVDLRKALDRMGIDFEIRSGEGWPAVQAARAAGLSVVLQGDSDRFPDGCSGAFDGDHCINLPPIDIGGNWGYKDPICKALGSQPEATLEAYAKKFNRNISFGTFTTPVPKPVVTPATYRVYVAAKATVRVYQFSKRPGVDCIKSWWDQQWGSRASSAAASAPVHRKTCDGRSGATTTKVLSGTFKGRHIRVGSGVILVEEA